jgi:uroporphyrinogen decarboxylase
MASALLRAFERFGWDGLNPGSDVAIEGEALGSKLAFPEEAPAYVETPGLANPDDLAHLRVPNPLKAGRMPVVIRATEMVVKEVGEEVFVMPCIMGPMNCSSQFRGVEDMLMDIVERPEFVERLLDFATDVVLEYGKALVDAGAHAILMGEALCTPGMISPKTYQSIIPRQRRLAESLKKYGAGQVLLHICGDVKRILPAMVEAGADLFDLDWQMDLAEAKQTCAPARVTMRGNLDPSILRNGTPDEVYQKSVEAIKAAGAGGGYILGSGCDVAAGTPYENLEAMMAAANETPV